MTNKINEMIIIIYPHREMSREMMKAGMIEEMIEDSMESALEVLMFIHKSHFIHEIYL